MTCFWGISAANGGTIAVACPFRVDLPRTDALYPGDFMRMLFIRSPQDFPFVRAGGAQQPFEVHAGNDILHPSVAVFVPNLGSISLDARRQDYRPYLNFHFFRGLGEINGIIFANRFAYTAFLIFQIKAAFIDISDQRNCLGEIDMHGFVFRDILIETIRVFHRAIFHTGGTTRTFTLDYVSGFFSQNHVEVTCFTFDFIDLGVSQDLNVRMPSNLDELRREYSDGAVIGREGLIKLRHVAADCRRFVHQVHLETRGRQV